MTTALAAARTVRISNRGDAIALAALARRFAATAGFARARAAEIALVTAELATNVAKHGGGGEVTLDFNPVDGQLAVRARDDGPPFLGFERACQDGWDDRGVLAPEALANRSGLATGLGAVRRLADHFEHQLEGESKVLIARFRRAVM